MEEVRGSPNESVQPQSNRRRSRSRWRIEARRQRQGRARCWRSGAGGLHWQGAAAWLRGLVALARRAELMPLVPPAPP